MDFDWSCFFSVTRRYRSDVCYWLTYYLIVSTDFTDVTLVSEDTRGDEEEHEDEEDEDEEYEEDEDLVKKLEKLE